MIYITDNDIMNSNIKISATIWLLHLDEIPDLILKW